MNREDEIDLFSLEFSSRVDIYLAVVFVFVVVAVVVVVFEVLAAAHLDVFFKYDLKCRLRTLLVQRFSWQSVYSEYYY